MSKNQVPFCALALLGFSAALAQDDLVTDRPDQTESSALVPSRRLQIEAGALFVRDEGVERLEVPGTLLRFGLTPRLELRLAWPGRLREDGPAGDLAGWGDPELGAKVALAPDLALIAHLSLPLGEDEVGSPRADPSVRLSASHDVAERVGVGWNVGWEAASDGTHTLARWIYTAALGIELGASWGTFVELFGDLPASDPDPAAHSVDAGVTFLVRRNLQLDLAAGVGLNGAAPDRFVGAGLSVRLPR